MEYTIRQERLETKEYMQFLQRNELTNDYPAERFKRRIEKLVSSVNVSLVARNKEGMVVGVLFGLTDYAYLLYVTDLAVDKDYKHQGIGPRLIKKAVAIAGGDKDIEVYFKAKTKNAHFYEKIGMKKATNILTLNQVDWSKFTVQ